jgi:hypothetical protein
MTSPFARLLLSLTLALALGGCGGQGTLEGSPRLLAGEPAVVVAPALPAAAEFIAMARASSCSEYANRLFLIDHSYVLWDQAGNCPDRSPAQTLFGATPASVLCSNGNSIAGPRMRCADARFQDMFESIVKNLQAADLGLGAGHTIEQWVFLPGDGAAIGFAKRDSAAATVR